MAYQMTWLADVLRAGGCKVEEVPGWKGRGRADMGKVRGVLAHHTAGAIKGDHPSLKLVVEGRSDLPGPLSQLFLARDGTYHVIAAGRCNHAGLGEWQGVTAGNSSFIGIEAENAGTGKDPWPDVQMDAYEAGVAAILLHLGEDAVMVAGHKEYAIPRGRKIDPAFDMVAFREDVETIMAGKSPSFRPVAVDPLRAMLRKGDRGTSVLKLQAALKITQDGVYGPATEKAVKAFQAANRLKADGLVGPATWEALGF